MATAEPQQKLIACHVISPARYSADYLWASAPPLRVTHRCTETARCDPSRIAQMILQELEGQWVVEDGRWQMHFTVTRAGQSVTWDANLQACLCPVWPLMCIHAFPSFGRQCMF